MKQTSNIKILNCLLTLLGFSGAVSCMPRIVCMYGMPTMDFEVSGKVVDQESAPIPGIKVSCQTFSEPGVVTTYTDKDGSFFVSGKETGATLKFEDVDGPENGGEFADKTENIKLIQIEKGKDWYMGKYEAKDVVIKLEEKK